MIRSCVPATGCEPGRRPRGTLCLGWTTTSIVRSLGGDRPAFTCARSSARHHLAADPLRLQVLIAELILAATPPDEAQLTCRILARLRAEELLADRDTRR